jgi:hypothetical protein
MGKVFVVQLPRRRNTSGNWEEYDISVASVYGILQPPLFGRKGVEFTTAPAVAEVKAKLAHYNDDDSILALGDPAAIAVVASIAADMNFGKFSILRWDGRSRQYVKLTFKTR